MSKSSKGAYATRQASDDPNHRASARTNHPSHYIQGTPEEFDFNRNFYDIPVWKAELRRQEYEERQNKLNQIPEQKVEPVPPPPPPAPPPAPPVTKAPPPPAPAPAPITAEAIDEPSPVPKPEEKNPPLTAGSGLNQNNPTGLNQIPQNSLNQIPYQQNNYWQTPPQWSTGSQNYNPLGVRSSGLTIRNRRRAPGGGTRNYFGRRGNRISQSNLTL